MESNRVLHSGDLAFPLSQNIMAKALENYPKLHPFVEHNKWSHRQNTIQIIEVRKKVKPLPAAGGKYGLDRKKDRLVHINRYIMWKLKNTLNSPMPTSENIGK